MATAYENALPAILYDLKAGGVFKRTDLNRLRQKNGHRWGLPDSFSASRLIELLQDGGHLTTLVLPSEEYSPLSRYVYDNPSPYTVALAIKEGSYLSHGTAVFLHGLNELIPQSIYVNKEQSKKPEPKGELQQDAIDRAFANKQRESRLSYTYKGHKITMLSGKHTESLEVGDVVGPSGEKLRATKIARTLVDIAVRPSYAGGVFQVLAAYRGAKDKVSIGTIIAVLRGLAYKYPYHQAVGFYLSRAGYPADDVNRLKDLGVQFNFYLDYGIAEKQRSYDNEWRLFYPKGL